MSSIIKLAIRAFSAIRHPWMMRSICSTMLLSVVVWGCNSGVPFNPYNYLVIVDGGTPYSAVRMSSVYPTTPCTSKNAIFTENGNYATYHAFKVDKPTQWFSQIV